MFQISPEILVDPSCFCCLILFYHSYCLSFSCVNRILCSSEAGKKRVGRTGLVSKLVSGGYNSHGNLIFWENQEAMECRAYLGVEGGGATKPLCSASVVFRLRGPFPYCKFDVCCGASGLCVVSWEKRTLSPSLNRKLGDREPVDGAQDYTAQACVLWDQHSSFQSSHVWVSPLKMAS